MIKTILIYFLAFFICFPILAQNEKSTIISRAKQALEERKKQGGADGTGPSAPMGTQERSIQMLEEMRDKMSRKNDGLEDLKPGGLNMLSNTDRENRTIASANMMRELDTGAYDNAINKSIPDPNAIDAEYARMNFVDKVGLSIGNFLYSYYWLLIMAVVLLVLFSWLGSSKSKRK